MSGPSARRLTNYCFLYLVANCTQRAHALEHRVIHPQQIGMYLVCWLGLQLQRQGLDSFFCASTPRSPPLLRSQAAKVFCAAQISHRNSRPSRGVWRMHWQRSSLGGATCVAHKKGQYLGLAQEGYARMRPRWPLL